MKIPVIMMFNDKYSIPAAVAIYSMLINADKQHQYILKILHTDISDLHQQKLTDLVKSIERNATLDFVNMTDFDKSYHISKRIAGYPKEIIYKLVVADLFPEFDRAIVTDVDVAYADDISAEFVAFDSGEYFAGVKEAASIGSRPFSQDITDKNKHFCCGAGYMIYNLDKMRQDKMPQKYLQFMNDNTPYLRLPDQEILNIVSWPNVKLLHPRNMALVAWWALDSFSFGTHKFTATKKEFEQAIANPVQIHYVTHKTWGKPWDDPAHAPFANIWMRYLSYTNFFQEYFDEKIKYKRKRKPRRKRGLRRLLSHLRKEK